MRDHHALEVPREDALERNARERAILPPDDAVFGRERGLVPHAEQLHARAQHPVHVRRVVAELFDEVYQQQRARGPVQQRHFRHQPPAHELLLEFGLHRRRQPLTEHAIEAQCAIPALDARADPRFGVGKGALAGGDVQVVEVSGC